MGGFQLKNASEVLVDSSEFTRQAPTYRGSENGPYCRWMSPCGGPLPFKDRATPKTMATLNNDHIGILDFIRQLLPANEFKVLEPMTGEAVLQLYVQHQMSSRDLAEQLVSRLTDTELIYGPD